MAIQEFDQNTVFNNPDLPSGALSSKQFNTIVELLGEGEIEGSATASKAGITDKTSTAYFNAFKKDIFLNGTQVLQEAARIHHLRTAILILKMLVSTSDLEHLARHLLKVFLILKLKLLLVQL